MTTLLILTPALAASENPNLAPLLAPLAAHLNIIEADVESLRMTPSAMLVNTADGVIDASSADWAWLVGFGARNSFLDKIQMLRLLAPGTAFINHPDAYVYGHAKYARAPDGTGLQYPPTFASQDPYWLHDQLLSAGGDWIAKPPAKSFGRDVFRINAADPNAFALLATLTGNGSGKFCLLQRFVPELATAEKRVLLVAGQVIGAYRKVNTLGRSSAANLAQGGIAEAVTLTSREDEHCRALAADLAGRGVNYAGIDMSGDWLLEINVVNPGGLATLLRLHTEAGQSEGSRDSPCARTADALAQLVKTSSNG